MADSILLLEDEKNLGLTLFECLKQEGFETQWSASLREAKSVLAKSKFSLALLDIGLPDGSGLEIAAEIRAQAPSTAIIFLTALGSPEDRIKGLELGAEDYIVKPFHLQELLLRIRNGLKRAHAIQNASNAIKGIRLGQATVFFSRFEIEVGGTRTPLTHKECQVLQLLYEKRGQVVSRDEIIDSVWSENEYPTTRTVDNFILKLRKLIEQNSEDPKIIRSVRGVGYQLL